MDAAIRLRYPRLIRCMRHAACLSEGEAVGAIIAWKLGKHEWHSEAVCHFGGFSAVVRQALRVWRMGSFWR